MSSVRLLWATVLVALMVAPAFAQNSQIQGTVVDQAGAAIPDANVTVTDSAKGVVVKQTKSTGDGSALFRRSARAPSQ